MQWRDLYLRLIHSYLFQSDVHSASIVLSKIMPNLLPTITQSSSSSSSSSSYPFAIRAWDAERLDIFNNDHALVDFDLVRFWMIAFLKECDLEKSVEFFNLCISEPRFRNQEMAETWIQSFRVLSDYQVNISIHSFSYVIISIHFTLVLISTRIYSLTHPLYISY